MKHLILTLVALCAFPLSQACAEGPATTYRYEGEVTGVVCNACSATVKHALLKLPGVKEVKVSVSKTGGVPRLTVFSTRPDLTRAEAERSLGKAAHSFEIRSLDLVSQR